MDSPQRQSQRETPARRSADLEIAALCRAQRLQAGVSLQEMAKRTHRDASSLSRFERGLVAPRDTEDLIREYRQLATELAERQHRPQPQSRAVWWPLAYLLVSLVALAAIAPLPDVGASKALRGWLALSAAALAIGCIPVANRARAAGNPRKVALIASYVCLLAATIVTEIERFHQPPLTARVALVTAAIGFGLIRLTLPER